jgi:aspartyl protease family protein
MDALDTGHFVYLAILGIAVVGWFIAENRASLGQTVRTALAWAFIFLGVVAGYGLWGDIRDDVADRPCSPRMRASRSPAPSTGTTT